MMYLQYWKDVELIISDKPAKTQTPLHLKLSYCGRTQADKIFSS
jgi:hypothetical protein